MLGLNVAGTVPLEHHDVTLVAAKLVASVGEALQRSVRPARRVLPQREVGSRQVLESVAIDVVDAVGMVDGDAYGCASQLGIRTEEVLLNAEPRDVSEAYAIVEVARASYPEVVEEDGGEVRVFRIDAEVVVGEEGVPDGE